MNTNEEEHVIESQFIDCVFVQEGKTIFAMKKVNFHFLHTQPLKLDAFIHDSRMKEKSTIGSEKKVKGQV